MMHPRRPASCVLAFTALLALSGQAIAADLSLKPARPAPATRAPAPASASPLAAPSAACLEWTDGCRVCQRAAGGEASCSNVGIACVPKEEQCTRR
jgi:hypothetical protein